MSTEATAPRAGRGLVILVGVLAALAVAGAGLVARETLARDGAAPAHDEHPHAHESAFGGNVQAVGAHHVEALVEDGGIVRLYVLGQDETELAPIPVASLPGQVLWAGQMAVAPVRLVACPEPGEPEGHASTFVGRLPEEPAGAAAALTVTVPLSGRLHRVRFDLRPHDDPAHAADGMPAGVPDDEAAELYRTPAGAYTEADIAANGRRTAAEAFRGFRARHDPNPEPGARVCPITNTLAHPECEWVVAGETHRFCCPPCVDEFVRIAKETPERLRPAASYVKE